MARLGLGPLLLAGAAAFGYYKYSKMTAAEKEQLKEKAKRFYEDNVPQNVRDMVAGKGGQQPSAANGAGGNYNGGTDGFTQM